MFVVWSTLLIQTEIFQPLLDGLTRHLVQIFMVPRWCNLITMTQIFNWPSTWSSTCKTNDIPIALNCTSLVLVCNKSSDAKLNTSANCPVDPSIHVCFQTLEKVRFGESSILYFDNTHIPFFCLGLGCSYDSQRLWQIAQQLQVQFKSHPNHPSSNTNLDHIH